MTGPYVHIKLPFDELLCGAAIPHDHDSCEGHLATYHGGYFCPYCGRAVCPDCLAQIGTVKAA